MGIFLFGAHAYIESMFMRLARDAAKSDVADLPTRGGAQMRSGRKAGCDGASASGKRPWLIARSRRASTQNATGIDAVCFISSVLASLSEAWRAFVGSPRALAVVSRLRSSSRMSRSLTATIVLR